MDLQSTKQSSQPPKHNVNLYCDECNLQIGIFNNEWIRLTAQYARSKEKGTHFGTEVGRSVQVVPDGKSAAGCTMAEIFCKKCSRTIGQYCKSAPSADKQHLVDQYFYRLSRVHLKDSQTSSRVEPQFGYGSDIAKTSTRSSEGLQNYASPRPISLEVSRGRSQNPHSMTPAAQGQSSMRSVQPPQFEYEDGLSGQQGEDNFMEHVCGKRHVSNGDTRTSSRSMDTKEQMSVLSLQLATLQRTVVQLVSLVQDLQPDRSSYRNMSAENYNADQFEVFVQTMRSAMSKTDELERLRKENKSMKARLDAIASAMGTAAVGQIVGRHDESTSPILSVEDATVLGKRKRQSQVSSTKSLRLEDGTSRREKTAQNPVDNLGQIPTPRSIGSSLSSNQVSSSQEIEEPSARAATRIEGDTYGEGGIHPSNAEELDPESTNKFAVDCSIPQVLLATEMQVTADSTEQGQLVAEEDTGGDLTSMGITDTMANESNKSNEPLLGEIPPNVEFSDDEQLSNTGMTPEENTNNAAQSGNDGHAGHADTGPDAIGNSAQAQDQNESETNAEQIDTGNDSVTRAAETRRSRRRITDSVVNHQIRSMAPEPAPRRRTLLSARSKATSLDKAEIYTPKTIEQKIKDKGKPRERKPHIQTTERLLNLELEELGLSEWIGKEKKSAEYRAAVDQARTRQREANKLAKLSNTGQSTHPVMPADVYSGGGLPYMGGVEQWNNPSGAGRYTPALQGPTSMHAHPLSDVTNQQGNRPGMATSEPQPKIPQALTRKEKQEEIRKRDQMAKEAMERESLA